MKKVRRYAEAGQVREGENEGIDSETRANALAFAREQAMQDLLASKGENARSDVSRVTSDIRGDVPYTRSSEAVIEKPPVQPKISSAPVKAPPKAAAPRSAPVDAAVRAITKSDADARARAREASEASNLAAIDAVRSLKDADVNPKGATLAPPKPTVRSLSKPKPRRVFSNRNAVRPAETEFRAKGGSVSSASKRADGIAAKGKTRGRMV